MTHFTVSSYQVKWKEEVKVRNCVCMFCFVKQTIFQMYTNTHITITTEQLDIWFLCMCV